MKDKLLGFLGLMRRANAITVGEENSGAAVKTGKARLLLLASDASDNARRRAEAFVFGRDVPLLRLPLTKEELAGCTGVSGGSMAAVNDAGFAAALVRQLAAQWPEEYGETAGALTEKLSRKGRRVSADKKCNGRRRTNHGHD